jgi:hypothetical protein
MFLVLAEPTTGVAFTPELLEPGVDVMMPATTPEGEALERVA